MILKQSTPYVRAFKMVLTSDHVSPATGKTVSVTCCYVPTGSVFTPAGPVTEINSGSLPGMYKVALGAGDTSLGSGDFIFHCTASLCDNTDFVDQINTTVFPDLQLSGSGQAIINSNIKQGQPLNGFTFIMTAGSPPAATTGLVVTAQRTLGAGGFSPCANSVVEIGAGWYAINLAATDTAAPAIGFKFSAPGANDQDITIITQP